MSNEKANSFKIGFIALCVLAILSNWIFTNFLPTAHGRVWPVTSRLVIESIREVPDGSIIQGQAVKNFDCNFQSIEWNLGNRNGRFAAVFAEFMDAPEIRDAGTLHWEGLFVGLDPTLVEKSSFSDVLHDCPGVPWVVRTPFYDGFG